MGFAVFLLLHPGRRVTVPPRAGPQGCADASLQSPGLRGDDGTIGTLGVLLGVHLNAVPADPNTAFWRDEIVRGTAAETQEAAAFSLLRQQVCTVPNWKAVIGCSDTTATETATTMASHPDLPRAGRPLPATPWLDAAAAFANAEDTQAVRYAASARCVDRALAGQPLAPAPVADSTWRHCVESTDPPISRPVPC